MRLELGKLVIRLWFDKKKNTFLFLASIIIIQYENI